MNRFFIIVAVCYAVVAVSAQGLGGPKSNEYKKYVDECKAETGITDDEIKAVLNNQTPTEKGWCFLGCINKKSGAFGPDNKINWGIAQQQMTAIKESNPALYDKLMPAMQQCKDQIESNAANLATPCTATKALGECMKSKNVI